MYFDNLNFGEALAVLEGINNNRIVVSDDHFSQSVQTLLNDLQIRTQSVADDLLPQKLQKLTGNNSDAAEESLEDCFLCLLITKKSMAYCESFYKAMTVSFKVFEKFCLIYKDYLNTKHKLDTMEA